MEKENIYRVSEYLYAAEIKVFHNKCNVISHFQFHVTHDLARTIQTC